MKSGLAWQPFLFPETVNGSIIARATAKNPAGAKKLEELTEIRAMYVTLAGIAAADVQAALNGEHIAQ